MSKCTAMCSFDYPIVLNHYIVQCNVHCPICCGLHYCTVYFPCQLQFQSIYRTAQNCTVLHLARLMRIHIIAQNGADYFPCQVYIMTLARPMHSARVCNYVQFRYHANVQHCVIMCSFMQYLSCHEILCNASHYCTWLRVIAYHTPIHPCTVSYIAAHFCTKIDYMPLIQILF